MIFEMLYGDMPRDGSVLQWITHISLLVYKDTAEQFRASIRLLKARHLQHKGGGGGASGGGRRDSGGVGGDLVGGGAVRGGGKNEESNYQQHVRGSDMGSSVYRMVVMVWCEWWSRCSVRLCSVYFRYYYIAFLLLKCCTGILILVDSNIHWFCMYSSSGC